MNRIALAAASFVLAFLAADPLAAQGKPSAMYDSAKRAIAAGSVVPERDLAPLVGVLRAPASTDDLRYAIDRIVTLSEARSGNPPAGRQYLLEQATPLLLKIGAEGPTPFARGDALIALRDMGASKAVVEQAAAIAERDRDDFVKSRGEILRNFAKSMPTGGGAGGGSSGKAAPK